MQTFKTEKEAIEYLDEMVEQGFLNQHGNGYSRCGLQVLNHGEYSSPDYVPVHYKDGWAIKGMYYYNYGTYNAPKNGRVSLTVYTSNDEFSVDILEIVPVEEL